MNLSITSEVERLRSVIVHTPGYEVSLVNPKLREELLFDDIIFESDARREHQEMLEIFRKAMPKGSQVLQITDLLHECFKDTEARIYFIDRLIESQPELNLHVIRKDLQQLPAGNLMEFVICGTTEAFPDFSLHPLPNLLFTRDLAAVIPQGVIISQSAKAARTRETLLMETLIEYHPMFRELKKDAVRIDAADSIEGGDVLIASPELVLIGMSERTTFSGLMKASDALLDRGVRNVVIVDIPKQRASMHLDTIFTFCGHHDCLVFPPAISERRHNVVAMHKENGKLVTEPRENLHETLEHFLDRSINFINCGGDNLTNQYREQWTDGANVFALAPGVIVGYERNTHTFKALEHHGYEIISRRDFVEHYSDKPFTPDSNTRMAITFEGNELCRGRGGARCMTLPLLRD